MVSMINFYSDFIKNFETYIQNDGKKYKLLSKFIIIKIDFKNPYCNNIIF